MGKISRILTDSECDKLQSEGRFVPRSVTLPNNPKVVSLSSKAERLDGVIRRDVAQLSKGSLWMRCWCVAVRAEDGFSWSAQGIQNALIEAFPTFNHTGFSSEPSTDKLPLIAQIVGVRRFLRLAAEHKLTTSFLSLKSWMTPLIVGGVLGLAVLIRALDVLLKVKSPTTAQQVAPVFLDGTFWLYAGLSSAAALAYPLLTPLLTNRTEAKSKENFLSKFAEGGTSKPYKDFIEELAAELAGLDFPRTVVIDRFDRLDSTTQQVIDSYFSEHSKRAIGSEFWVVFESEQKRDFASLAALQPKAHGYSQVRLAFQAPLDRAEKQGLVELLGLDPHVIEFESVKTMFESRKGIDEQIALRFKDYRSHHPVDPARYGVLDLTHLLALTARPVSVAVSDEFLRKNLSVKEGTGAQLLRQFLRGTSLRRDEISAALVDVRNNFGSVLGFGQGEQPQIRIIPEAADVLKKMADELALPPVGLGHLFWAVFWYSSLVSHAREALWMEKLSHHLLEAEVWHAEPAIIDAALSQAIDATFFAIRGCIQACVFEWVEPLLQQGSLLLSSGSQAPSGEKQLGLRELCGEAIALLGGANVGRVLRELRAMNPHLVKNPGASLDVLGLETAILADNHELLAGDFGRVHAQHLRLRAAWLALSVRQVLQDSTNGLFAQAVVESIAELKDLREGARRRMEAPASPALTETEVLNLSLAIWCSALVPLFLEFLVFQQSPSTGQAPDLNGENAVWDYFSYQVEFAADALALTSMPDRRPDVTSNLLSHALRRDLAATAAAAIFTSCRLIQNELGSVATKATRDWPEELRQKVVGVMQSIATIFDDELPYVGKPEDLTSLVVGSKIDDWMHLDSMMWHAFNLDQLRHFSVIRRTQFNARSQRNRTQEYDRLLLQSEGSVIEREDYAGLLANAVAADSLKDAAELSAIYLRRAGSTALRVSCGAALRREFCHLAIGQGHTLDLDFSEFLEYLLTEDGKGMSGLEVYLGQLSPGSLSSVANRYLNAARNTGKVELGQRVRSCIQAFLDKHSDDQDAADTQALLDLNRLLWDLIAKRPVAVEREMEVWRQREESWLYAAFLNTLYDWRIETAQARHESARLLQSRIDGATGNAPLLLAISIIERCADRNSSDARIALDYIRKWISLWQQRMTAQKNVELFTRLSWLDPDHKREYAVPLAKWQLVRLHRAHLQQYPQLLSQGQYFLLFASYFDAMEVWGLHTELGESELRKRRELPADKRREIVLTWRKSSARPVAFKLHSRTSVMADFLTIGAYLFEQPLADDAEFSEDRSRFNDTAKDALPGLLSRIIELEEVPKAIKELLQLHTERMYRFSLPPDLPEKAAQGAAAS